MKENTSENISTIKKSSEKTNITALANRQLTEGSFKHFKSLMDFSNSETPAFQLIEGLRYFERRQKINDKLAFSWDDEVNMDRFGECAITVCRSAKEIFQAEDPCLKLKSPCYVLGDIHGNYKNLHRYEQSLFKMGLAMSTNQFLFLGDYVDRGEHGLEVILFLFSQKILARDRIFLIRGNHELRSIQKYFSFHEECIKKFGETLGETVWREINKTMDYLPLAAVVDDQIFCVHGGIPRPSLYNYKNMKTTIYEELNSKIETPLNDVENQCPLAWDLLWSDPKREEDIVLIDDEEFDKLEDDELKLEQYELVKGGHNKLDIGFGPNPRRGTACIFNERALSDFLNRFKDSRKLVENVRLSG